MKNFIYGTALMMVMMLSANTFAKPNSFYGEKSKKEMRSNYGKKDDMKKGQGKSCHHHHKKGCHKK
ncbi:MAG: hypothetical protein U0U67_06085 [Chitinophagales bacterium]